MVGDLFTWPLRAGLQAAELVLRPVAEATERAVELSRQAVDSVSAARSEAAPAAEPDAAGEQPERAPSAVAEPVEPEPVDTAPEPPRVSEEPVVVAEVADAEAAEGAGADVSVAEPWEGYRGMSADEVIARVQRATPEEIAVVQLYEGVHRRRRTVLEAAEQHLRAAGP